MRFLLALALATTVGCVVHDHRPPGHWRVVVVETGHICGGHCDHFWVDGVWYVIPGHVHVVDCGHYFVDGHWGHMKPPPGQVRKIEEHRDVNVHDRGPEHRDVKIQERGPERAPEHTKKEAAPQEKGPKDKEPKKDKDDEDKGPKGKGPKGK